MTPRTSFTLALIPATLAAHLLVAACGGSEGTSHAGPGAGGSGGSGSGSGAGGAAAVTTGAGVTTGSVTTGSGGSGPVPQCDCAPKPPAAFEVPCKMDPTTVMIAELEVSGASMADLARVVAIGHQTDPQLAVGSANYNAITLPVRIGDGHVSVTCDVTGMPYKQQTKSVTFYVPQ